MSKWLSAHVTFKQSEGNYRQAVIMAAKPQQPRAMFVWRLEIDKNSDEDHKKQGAVRAASNHDPDITETDK